MSDAVRQSDVIARHHAYEANIKKGLKEEPHEKGCIF
jgi:hypothetical protein